MGQRFDAIGPKHRAFIERQRVFFVASATAESRVNVSPKGLDALRVIDANGVAYLDHTGSGNETAAHLLADGRLTIMFCAFEGPPMILRLYGHATSLPRGTPGYAALAPLFADADTLGPRQIVRLAVDLVQTSCGFAVPLFDYREERKTLPDWAAQRGEEGMRAYRRTRNARSIDGLPTRLPEPEDDLAPAEG